MNRFTMVSDFDVILKIWSTRVYLTHFRLIFPFYTSRKLQKLSPVVFWCFQGVKKGSLARNGLTRLSSDSVELFHPEENLDSKSLSSHFGMVPKVVLRPHDLHAVL